MGWHPRPITWPAILTLLLLATAARAATLPPAVDLRAESDLAAKSGGPLVVMVSLEGCPHCELVRRQHLLPLATSGAVVRQVEVNKDLPLIDFDGTRFTHARFARLHGVQAAPTVFFFDRRGKRLAEPLQGTLLPDFYASYLREAMEKSRAALAAPPEAPKANP